MTAIDYFHQTTLITGASSGIGAAFAHELARRGSNLVLVARRLDRLRTLASELEADHGVRVTPIALDLSVPHAGRALAADLAERAITITSLINNAGFGTDGTFQDEDPDVLTQELNVNIANLVDITRAFIDPLRTAGVGILVNIASMAAYAPGPNMAVYSASKAFVLSFTEALWFESRGTGLRVLSFAPGLTRTEFFDRLDGGAYRGNYQTPEQVASTALRALDRDRGPSMQSGLRNTLATVLPRFFTRRFAVIVSGMISDRSRPGADSGRQVVSVTGEG